LLTVLGGVIAIIGALTYRKKLKNWLCSYPFIGYTLKKFILCLKNIYYNNGFITPYLPKNIYLHFLEKVLLPQWEN
jgi:hypothetical protein